MSLKQKLVRTWTTLVMLYTSGPRAGWRHGLLHTFTCTFTSLTFSSLLFLILHMSADRLVSGLIAGSSCLFMSIGLFFFKGFRCFILLLIISCIMKQGRNILLATGAGLGVVLSIRNMYKNLLEVSRSIECNLEKKKELLDLSPIGNYVRMMRWVKEKLNMVSGFGVAKFEAQMYVSWSLKSDELRNTLDRAKKELKDKADRAEVALDFLAFVWKMVAPGLGIVLLVVLAALFLKKFTRDKRYNNLFITSRFVEFDEHQKALGKPHVLPLTKKEARRYIFIPSVKPSLKEGWPVAKYFIPVGSYVLCWFIFIGLDKLLHWIISVTNEKLMSLEPFHVPLKMSINGTTTLLSFISLNEKNNKADFSFSVSMFESECAPQPTQMFSQAVVPLSAVIAVLLILGLMTAKLLQVKLLVAEHFFTEDAGNRVEHLHGKILRNRSKENSVALDCARFQSLKKDVKFWFPILDYCCGKHLYSQNLRQRGAHQNRA